MNGQPNVHRVDTASRSRPPWLLLGLIGCQAVLYIAISLLSFQFDSTLTFQQRPILIVLLSLAMAFALHLWSLRLALRSANQAFTIGVILWGTILFRAIFLPSLPIQEIDIYRYLWDGAVVASGGNPYSFSPQQVLTASEQNNEFSPNNPQPADLERLVDLPARSAATQESLQRIHYAELITIYPPVSQLVFALSAVVIPDAVSLYWRVLAMKAVLTLFDVITIFLLLAILRSVGRHPAWSILYAWSPLVLKEYANSGHLDSIAVCLTTAAVLCLLRSLRPLPVGRQRLWWIVSAVLLGLGIGAKLYPVLLIPVLGLWLIRSVGCRTGVAYAGLAVLGGGVSLAPMWLSQPVAIEHVQSGRLDDQELPDHVAARSGLTTFLSRWEINDLVFLVIVENLRPDSVKQTTHWFVIIPQTWRSNLAHFLSRSLECPKAQATFLTARLITLLLFCAIVLSLLWRAWAVNQDELWLQTVFLTLAWFWAFAPTQNPWYWTWALPFLPFAGRRTWSLVSLLVLAYYLRFWLLYQYPQVNIAGTNYPGEQFFHFVVAPLEHGLWLLFLSAEILVFPRVWLPSQTARQLSE